MSTLNGLVRNTLLDILDTSVDQNNLWLFTNILLGLHAQDHAQKSDRQGNFKVGLFFNPSAYITFIGTC